MTSCPPHAHVVVHVTREDVVLIRRVRQGRVYWELALVVARAA